MDSWVLDFITGKGDSNVRNFFVNLSAKCEFMTLYFPNADDNFWKENGKLIVFQKFTSEKQI